MTGVYGVMVVDFLIFAVSVGMRYSLFCSGTVFVFNGSTKPVG